MKNDNFHNSQKHQVAGCFKEINRIKIVALIFLVLLVITGCSAPLPPAQTASDVNSLAGEWKGTLISFSGNPLSATLTIMDDGHYKATVPALTPPTFTGVISVVDGQYRGQSDTGRTFTYTLHENDIERILVAKADDGRNSAKYKQKK